MYLVLSTVLVWGAAGAWSTLVRKPDSAAPDDPFHAHLPGDDAFATFCHLADGPTTHIPTDSHFRLETKYERDKESQTSQLLLRAPVGCRNLSTPVTLALTLKTSLPECATQVNVSYIGQALQTTLTGAWSSALQMQATVAGPEHSLPHQPPLHLLLILKTQWGKNFRVVWDGVAKSVILMAPKFDLILSSGVERKESELDVNGDGVQWWCLCVQDWDNTVGGHAYNSQHRCQASAATRPKGDGVVEVLARRHSTTVGHHTWLTRFSVDVEVRGKLQHLLNFTFHSSSHQKGWQQVMLQFPVLQLILEATMSTKRNKTSQYVDITAEIRNSATEAIVKFLSWEVTALHDAEATDFCCGHDEDVTGSTKSSDGECVSEGHSEEHCPYSYMEPDSENSPLSGTSPKRKPKSEERVQEVRQVIISDVFNLKSNMTIHAMPTGEHIVRIHQDAHSPFCPLLGWSLNQIFNFSRDFSGWEYVVSQWAWGNMVVRGEWGVSPLQWYQKTFSFSLDQAAPLPSTHLILDFRNSSRFLALVRWPTLATALTASVNIHHSHYNLQVKEVDEFKEEDDRVVLEVAAKKNQAGLAFTWTLDAERTTHLYTVATTLLSQAASHPWMCGDSLVDHPIRQFVEDLLGQNLDHLWETIVLQGWHILQWLSHGLELDQVWELVREELAASEPQLSPSHGNEEPIQAAVWAYVWAAAERLGVLRNNPEGKGIVVVMEHLQEWTRVAQRFWELLTMENIDKCHISYQLSVIVEDLMSQLKHLWLN